MILLLVLPLFCHYLFDFSKSGKCLLFVMFTNKLVVFNTKHLPGAALILKLFSDSKGQFDLWTLIRRSKSSILQHPATLRNGLEILCLQK